ncbi:hypothetical protein DY000_02012577 [Brassica cretica]|uniref:Uncharacterized protein n=1 Tax=Brassica cretica TaxID=69181 RepID=A0ABQ7D9Z9_BRACR|nr:hypothetical protein DY000_02012577 [Brassica cretica]
MAVSDRFKSAAASRTLDIDSADKDNDLGAVEYVEDMYSFYKEVEQASDVYADTY